MNRISRILAGLVVMAIAIPAIAQVTDEEIDRAREEVDAMLAGSQQLGDDIQTAWARQYSLENEIADLEASIELAKAQIQESKQRLEEVAVELYMGSSSSATLQILFSMSNGEYEAGVEYLRNVSGDQADIVNQLRSYRAELDRQTERLAEASAEQQVLAAQLQEMASELQADLVDAQALYEDLVAQQAAEEEAKRRAEEDARRQQEAAATSTSVGATTATSGATTSTSSGSSGTTTTSPANTTTTPPPPVPSGGGACPVAGATIFTDTFGAPRSGGRVHEGVDMMAAHMTPVVAIYSGTITSLTYGSLSGNAIWLESNAGDTFFYAHLDSYADIVAGQKVTEGQVIGYVGDTGNAPPGVYHLHFEFHPGGGAAVNPYPLVKSLC